MRALALVLLALASMPEAAVTASRAELDPRFARARSLADEKRFDEAIAIADSLTSVAPEIFDYRLFHARCLGWDDRNRASAAAYHSLASRHPERLAEIGPEWARQLLWSGRSVEALALADRLLAEGAGDGSLRSVRAEAAAAVSEWRRPWARAMAARSSDSDDLEIGTLELTAGAGATRRIWLGGSVRHDAYDTDERAIGITRVGFIARARRGDLDARLHVRAGSSPDVSFDPVTLTSSLSWSASDLVELFLGLERVDYESVRALEREVIGQFATAGLALRPGAGIDARASAGAGLVDGPGAVDRNTRLHTSAEIGWLALERPRTRLSLAGYAFSFSERTSDGYWNPDSYATLVAGIDVNPSFPAVRSEIVLAGQIGVQKENPGESSTTGRAIFRVIHRVGEALTLEYRLDTSDSGVASERGFARDRHEIGLTGRF